MSMHRRMVDKALADLDEERAAFFTDMVNLIEEDRRVDRLGNLIYLVLKETMRHLPLMLGKKELIRLLFEWVNVNQRELSMVLFDKRYIQDPASIRKVTNGFVLRVSEAALTRHAEGTIEKERSKVKSFRWPYTDTDFPLDEP
jgi:hypothetical protein